MTGQLYRDKYSRFRRVESTLPGFFPRQLALEGPRWAAVLQA
jgi:hypothetical protein